MKSLTVLLCACEQLSLQDYVHGFLKDICLGRTAAIAKYLLNVNVYAEELQQQQQRADADDDDTRPVITLLNIAMMQIDASMAG